ncbi:MAG: hypothetical protein FWB73_06975 [Treponema sp.]|nr:hypothetical protein [Treponema sp.]
MFRIVVLNLGFLVCTAVPLLPSLLPKLFNSDLLVVIFGVAGTLVCSVYLSAAANAIKVISDYGTFTYGDFIRSFKITWPAGIAVFAILLLLYMIFSVVIPFYGGMGSVFGLVLSMVVIWITVFALLSFQYFFTVYARLGNSIKKTFKKCMLISLDNTGLSIFLIFHNLLALIISIIFVFMFPGPVGILLYLDEALRLRLLKYDWLEANPDANRKKIPWDAILIEEREKTGTRTFRNFIFPWKD